MKNKWKNEDFNRLCNRLKTLNLAKITDIIFHLLDWSGESRKNLVNYLIKIKQNTMRDGEIHDFSIQPDDKDYQRVGVTYLSLNSDNPVELKRRLLTLSQARKYRSKGNIWIGFGSLYSSTEMIDAIVFNDESWEYDKELEELSKDLLDKKGHGRQIRLSKKIGRNEKCICGSGLKSKKCCGRKI